MYINIYIHRYIYMHIYKYIHINIYIHTSTAAEQEALRDEHTKLDSLGNEWSAIRVRKWLAREQV